MWACSGVSFKALAQWRANRETMSRAESGFKPGGQPQLEGDGVGTVHAVVSESKREPDAATQPPAESLLSAAHSLVLKP